METQVRRRTGAVQWTHAAPGAEAPPAADIAPREAPAAAEDEDAPLRELVGSTFSSAKELRHLAEREMGELFVPVELLAESAPDPGVDRDPFAIRRGLDAGLQGRGQA